MVSKEQRTLEEIRQALGLEELPVRIEAFDVSNLQGSNIVGASVMFQDGRPLKDGYRRYKVRRTRRNRLTIIPLCARLSSGVWSVW